MAEFGLPNRNATDDANAGVINPPAKKSVARDQNISRDKVRSTLDEGVEAVGTNLGNALAKKVTDYRSNIKEQKKLDATIRQGVKHSINEVDKVKKRTGWQLAVYGQDEEYRAAQQQAAKTIIKDRYNEEAVSVDEYAGDAPDEYHLRLKKGLDAELDKFTGDKDTQRVLAKEWQQNAAKLASKHYAAHYAWNQQQQAEVTRRDIAVSLDTYNIDTNSAISLEEVEGFKMLAKDIFNLQGSHRRKGQTAESYSRLVNEEVNTTLRNGNINAFKLSTEAGWEKSLNAADKVKRDQAIGAYDTDFNNQVGTSLSNGEVEAMESKSVAEASVAYDVLDGRIDELEQRESGTDRGKKIIADARKRIAQGRNRALTAGSKAQVKAENTQKMVDSWNAGNTLDIGNAQTELKPTKKERAESFDVHLFQSAGVNGVSVNTMEEYKDVVMSNPTVAAKISNEMIDKAVVSPMFLQMSKQFTGGFTSLFDEDGKPLPAAETALGSVSQFMKSDAFRNKFGTAEYDNYIEIRNGIQGGLTAEQIKENIARFQERSDNMATKRTQWPLGYKDDRVTQEQYIGQLVQSVTGQFPSDTQISSYLADYQRGLIHSNDSHEGAQQYLRGRVKTQRVQVKNQTIEGGSYLDEISKHGYSFNDLIETAENDNLLAAFIAVGGGNTRRFDAEGKPMPPISKLEELGAGWRMTVDDGIDGVVLHSQAFKEPVVISSEWLNQWDQRRELQRINKEALDDGTAAAYVKEFQKGIASENPLKL